MRLSATARLRIYWLRAAIYQAWADTNTRMELSSANVDPMVKDLSATATSHAASLVRNITNTTAQAASGMLGSTVYTSVTFVPRLLYWIISFITITLPTWLFSFLSTSLTFTMNMTTILLFLAVVVSTISWFVRYRLLNMYSRLPPEPQRTEPQVEVFPETQERDSKPGLSNYFDEFLSAIKVFGYLERPVFHELTRTMQTRKLLAGETLLLEEEKGFCIVVDGLVQIFVKSGKESAESNESAITDDEAGEEQSEGSRTYQLLTEVRNGAPMSSLFSILALFTENVKLRHESDSVEHGDVASIRHSALSSVNFGGSSRTPDGTRYHSPSTWNHTVPRSDSRHRTLSNLASNGTYMRDPPPLVLDNLSDHNGNASRRTSDLHNGNRHRHHARKQASAHPDIVARATVDTTIAIIPATAFHRLTRIYPKATAHIVQVILTRLQRVTLATGHAYLGLTSEVLRTEKLMNKYTTYDLPAFLHGEALDRLKEKFRKEQERIPKDESMKGIALHNPHIMARRRSSTNLRREVAISARIAAKKDIAQSARLQKSSTDDKARVSAGDLLTNIHAARHPRQLDLHISEPYSTTDAIDGIDLSSMQKPEHSFDVHKSPRAYLVRQQSMDGDILFRKCIMECMAKAIGLTNVAQGRTESVAASPRINSWDSKRQTAIFNNAFGMMDMYEGSTDGDTESIASASAFSSTGLSDVLEDMRNEVEIVYFPKDAVLVEEGERNPGLYYVIDGFLDVNVTQSQEGDVNMLGSDELSSGIEAAKLLNPRLRRQSQVNSFTKLPSDTQTKRKPNKSLFLIKPGGLAGYLGTVSSHRSFVNVTAKTDVFVGFLPRASVEKIVERNPVVLLTMAKRLATLLPRLIMHIDFALEWVQVNAGQMIYHQDDDSDAIYIVLNGRLRAIQEGKDGQMKVIGEFGQGDSVGELEVLTESRRPGTLHAIRDTELAKLPKTLFNSLAQEHPGITIKVSKIIAARMRSLIEGPNAETNVELKMSVPRPKVTSTHNLRTVAIVPCTTGVPVVEFGRRLQHALHQVGTTNGVTSLDQASILGHLGRHAFNRLGKLKLSQYLADLEEKYGLVLYIADTSVKSPWTMTCIAQADCIYLVGVAGASPSIGEYERVLLTTKTTARKELVLLHPERYCPAGLTRQWLRNRPWVNGGHHHVQMAVRNETEQATPPTKKIGNRIKQRVQILQAEIQKYTSQRIRQTPLYAAETPYKGDFHRLARILCGKSVGLVLGGGGARGIAHVGIIRALEEAGIPIDLVGGTSIGSFIGALYAQDADIVPMYGRAKRFAGRMASMWRFVLDATYPSASYTTGHEFNRGIFKTFGNKQIEDCWLEFYCNTTNISKSRLEVHTSGYVWRYVRASMSLAGLLPPLCDDGDMLLDGGYVDNLTVSYMKGLGADIIFAIDVGSLDDDNPQTYGDSLSGIWASLNRWNPFSSIPNPPTLSEIQARLAYVSSYENLERAKAIPGVKYLRPPIEHYGTLEFGKFDEIYQVGYQYGKRYLAELRAEGVLPFMEETEAKKNLRRTMAPRRASI
ncbi:hypothetical protein AMS68_000631 [Peltaster fructicola]|uniref:Lysophospholipase NTE1 n=1 Tax=Peltaster fructicola TaxID=286661 RepID=A0A6H0XK63_9PEZI|nr:hypothetical protein AMS68_000631 [Peltaster fructicola]